MNPSRMPRLLVVAAGAMGLLATVAGSPYAGRNGRIDVEALARAVEHEDDHVTAIELAGWIKERRDGLRVVDVRSQAEYDAYHLPSAEHIAIDSLTTTPFHAHDTIVLYSEGGAHAAQAWVFLRALGYEKVFFLRGGLYEWLEQVISPTLPVNAPAKDSAAVANVASLSRYFGGVPHFGDVAATTTDAIPLPGKTHSTGATNSLLTRVRRRGC